MPKTTLCWITVVRLPQPLQLVGLTNTNQTYVCIYVCVMCVHDILNPLFVLLQLHETLLPFEKLTSRYAVCFPVQCHMWFLVDWNFEHGKHQMRKCIILRNVMSNVFNWGKIWTAGGWFSTPDSSTMKLCCCNKLAFVLELSCLNMQGPWKRHHLDGSVCSSKNCIWLLTCSRY